MANITETFTVTPAQWPALQNEAAKELGVPISGNSGSAIEPTYKIEFAWSYAAAQGRLTLTEYDLPILLGGIIRSKINAAFAQALANVNQQAAPPADGGDPVHRIAG